MGQSSAWCSSRRPGTGSRPGASSARVLGPEVIGESGSAQEATRRIPALRPDVALLVARLLDGSGIDTCRDVRAVDPGIAALIVTSYDDEQALVNAVAAGAAGYVLKDVRGNHLVSSIRRVAAGESLIDDPRRATASRAGLGPARAPTAVQRLFPNEDPTATSG